jgi:hypothetical protein
MRARPVRIQGSTKGGVCVINIPLMEEACETMRAILAHYERSAEEWVHPGRDQRIRERDGGDRLLERWHDSLLTIAERFDERVHTEYLNKLLETRSDPQTCRRSGHAIGAYLWELAKRDDKRLIAPEALRTLKPAYRAYLEPILALIELTE